MGYAALTHPTEVLYLIAPSCLLISSVHKLNFHKSINHQQVKIILTFDKINNLSVA